MSCVASQNTGKRSDKVKSCAILAFQADECVEAANNFLSLPKNKIKKIIIDKDLKNCQITLTKSSTFRRFFNYLFQYIF